MSTNIQDFSGDVQIRGTTFIKANRVTGDIAIGTDAGLTSQGDFAVAVGYLAGETSQGDYATAVGREAGETSQGTRAIAVGVNAGNDGQGTLAVAVGSSAGQNSQGLNAVAVGVQAGQNSQGANTVAVGREAGKTSQGDDAIAVGYGAGGTSQGIYATALGRTAGQFNQGENAVAVGNAAGQTSQGNSTVAVGTGAGQSTQSVNSVAIGANCGRFNQGERSTAIGIEAGHSNQAGFAVAVGGSAGQNSQGVNGAAFGYLAGQIGQGSQATAVGTQAGRNNQGNYAAAVGYFAGSTNQGIEAVAVGYFAGANSQGRYTTAVGVSSGRYNQGDDAVAVGPAAGQTSQGASAVAVGLQAGSRNQGGNGVAVGVNAGRNSQGANTTAIGTNSGNNNQGTQSVAIGFGSGSNAQGTSAVSVGGGDCGLFSQGDRAVAIGASSARNNQGDDCVAVGHAAGYHNQGANAIAIGNRAGFQNQSVGSICLNATGGNLNNNAGATFQVKPVSAGAGNADLRYDTGNGLITYNTSDDRVKDNEVFIINAIRTLKKLKPQTYDKRTSLDSTDVIKAYEAGLMAQDIWYDAPELRHLVVLSETANPTLEKPTSNTNDPQDDPDYSTWGSGISTIDYTQLITYLIKAVQEIVTELPRSKTTVSNTWGQNISGLVVSANENVHKTNTTPIVALSNVNMDKAWYGVVSDKITDTNDYDTLIDTKGDTQIWVTDIGGPLESGDLLTTSNVSPGFTQKQSDDIVRNYTVAKMTQDCDFTEPVQRAIRVPRQELSNVTYYIAQHETIISKSDYDQIGKEGGKTTETVSEYRKNEGDEFGIAQEEYDTLEPSEQEENTRYEKIVYYRVENYETKYPRVSHPNIEIRQELVDVLDANGQIVWEDTANTVPAYTLVDHGTYKAALVSCKLI